MGHGGVSWVVRRRCKNSRDAAAGFRADERFRRERPRRRRRSSSAAASTAPASPAISPAAAPASCSARRTTSPSHTSSSSTKLIHGGLRYLEYRQFGLVRKALLEREVLLKGAPHIMWPLRFVMPHDPSMRPAWMIRLGLFLYDHLARREVLPGSEAVDLRRARGRRAAEAGVHEGLRLFRRLGRRRAARGALRRRCGRARRHRAHALGLPSMPCAAPTAGGRSSPAAARRETVPVRARALVNAAGPVGGAVPQRARARERPRRAAPGQGQPHRRAEAVRPRPRVHLPERRRADHLRHSLRRRLHPDRHDRRRASRPDRRGAHRRVRDRLSLHPGEPLLRASRSRRSRWSGPTAACGRCSTTSRATSPR